MVDQIRLYRCKVMPDTAALHIFRNPRSKMCQRKVSINQVGITLLSHIHYENMSMQYTAIFHGSKNEKKFKKK